jgi:hypothetical protein
MAAAARSFVQWGLHLAPGCGRRIQPTREASPNLRPTAGRSLAPLDRARPHGYENAGSHSAQPTIADKDEVGGSTPSRPTTTY